MPGQKKWSKQVTEIRVIKSESEVGLGVTIRDETITITLPETWFTVSYRKLADLTDLVATSVVNDEEVAMRKADFLVRASRIANNKARALGWIG